MICFICHAEEEKLKHFSLYVMGSEGIDLCHLCEINVINFITILRESAGKTRIEQVKKNKKENKS